MTPMLGIMSGSRQAFTPASLSNLAGWWDPSDASSVTVASNLVSQVNDKSGNGRHFVQATSAQQPTYSLANKNGLNVLTFNGIENNSYTLRIYSKRQVPEAERPMTLPPPVEMGTGVPRSQRMIAIAAIVVLILGLLIIVFYKPIVADV